MEETKISWEPNSSDTTGFQKESIHYLAKYIIRSSAVLQAVCGRFRSPSSCDIILGKETSIELVVVGKDGALRSVCEQTVFGIIKDIVVLCPNENSSRILNSQRKDLLVVLSDSGMLTFLTFCTEVNRFYPTTHVQLSSLGSIRDQLGRMLAVDSNGCYIAVSAYENHLALVSISTSTCRDETTKNFFDLPGSKGSFDLVDIPNGTIWSTSFISRNTNAPEDEYNPILAIIINRTNIGFNELYFFSCYKKGTSLTMFSSYSDSGSLSLSITDVPHIFGFALLFRANDAILLDISDPYNPCNIQKINFDFLREVEEYVNESSRGLDVNDEDISVCALLELRDSREHAPMSVESTADSRMKRVCLWSWEPLESGSSKLVFSLNTGALYMLDIYLEDERARMIPHGPLFHEFPCIALLWARGGFIAAFGEMGDGNILKLENGKVNSVSPIENIAPIFDMSFLDYHEENRDQMFACSGVGSGGSLRTVRSGINVEKLTSTPPTYIGVTGLWTLHMKVTDHYHSFLVLSFVEETRVLSVGMRFCDISDSIGFKSNVCTLACGLLIDGILVQIHKTEVRVCLPTVKAHLGGICQSTPIIKSWHPDAMSISQGTVGNNHIIIATTNPFCLSILAVNSILTPDFEIYKLYNFELHDEVSCISIPNTSSKDEKLNALSGVKINNIFVIGTHKPSVNILSFTPKEGIKVVAVGDILIDNSPGDPFIGCIPEDVRFVLVDRCYVLSGLRNGMLLRFEFPWDVLPTLSGTHTPVFNNHFSKMGISVPCGSLTSSVYMESSIINSTGNTIPVKLQIVALRHIGLTPVFLVPLQNSLDSDIIVLSDRPWLLQSARHNLVFTSISFGPATHVTPVSNTDCHKGILFVAENKLHLIEMSQTKRINAQKIDMSGTPRKILYHNESNTLLVIRITQSNDSFSSDICHIDPLRGSVHSRFKFEPGETGKCMQIVKSGNDEMLLVGTCQLPERDPERGRGRLVVLSLQNIHNSNCRSNLCLPAQLASPFNEHTTEQISSTSHCNSPDNISETVNCDEDQAEQFTLIKSKQFPGVITSICSYLDHYFLITVGNILFLFGLQNINWHRIRKLSSIKTRFHITCVTTHLSRIAVADCRDGVLYFSYYEDVRSLVQIYADPIQRLVSDCLLLNLDTIVASDKMGNISILSSKNDVEDNATPESNLTPYCTYYSGETIVVIKKGSFSYKFSVDDKIRSSVIGQTISYKVSDRIIGCTLLGSVMIFIPLRRKIYELLKVVQASLAHHPLTAPILGNDLHEFRTRGSLDDVPAMLDGDMLIQFLELTCMEQQSVLSQTGIPVSQVGQVLEEIHHALS